MIIRSETPSDYDAIRHINIAAFAVHPYSQQTEHLIVEALRDDNALSVSLVVEMDDAIVGHIAFSRAKIDDKDCDWFLLGPVAVLPERQSQGIGSALVRQGLEAIRALGAEGCVLVGNPEYYRRFGFRQAGSLVLDDVPPEYFMALPMTDKAACGKVTYHAAFAVQA